MKTAVASDDDEPYDWADDASLTLSLTWSRFEQLRPVPVTTTGGPAATLTVIAE